MMTRALAVALGAAFAAAITVVHAQQPPGAGAAPLDILPAQNGIHLIGAAGGNIVVQVGAQGVLVVDTGAAGMTDAVRAAIRTISDRPIRYVINTSGDADHTAGNAALSSDEGANEAFNVPGNFGFRVEQAPIVATEASYRRLSEAMPFAAWPTSTFFSPKKTMWFDGGIEILAMPAAHTDGDLIVHFRQADVIAAGDVYVTTGYPVIDIPRGGSIQGIIDAANRIIDITIPRFNQQGGTLVVPGHGRMTDAADVAYYRDMVTIMHDRVREMTSRGMTLPQIKTARLTRDYDGRFGKSPSWTPDMFVEAIYRSLSPKT
jgi:glyoxylase-like metal-dependent hydrolase (beta-lactamase superfamily II)